MGKKKRNQNICTPQEGVSISKRYFTKCCYKTTTGISGSSKWGNSRAGIPYNGFNNESIKKFNKHF